MQLSVTWWFLFFSFKAVLKVVAQASFLFKRLLKRKMWNLSGCLLGTTTKEKGPHVARAKHWSLGSLSSIVKCLVRHEV